MLRMFATAILIVALLLPVHAAPNAPFSSAPERSTWLTAVPAGWVPVKSDAPQCLMVVVDSKHPDHQASLAVVYDVVGDATLDEVFKAAEKMCPLRLENYKLLKHVDAKVGGLPAYCVVYTYTVRGVGAVECKCYAVIRKGYAYTFIFGSLKKNFDSHAKDFDSNIQSITWIDPPKK